MRWFLVMWLFVTGVEPEDHGITYRKVEMHLTKESCAWALSELRIAKGQVASAECQARMRIPEPSIIRPEILPRSTRDVVEKRP